MLSPEAQALVLVSTGAERVSRAEHVQSLWGGFGALWRVELCGAEAESVIVKEVRPPRAAGAEVSHLRKRRSYDVECAFYARYAARCPEGARIAEPIAQRSHDDGWLLVLEDLDRAGYAHRTRARRGHELEACLRWLASFHAHFLGERPSGLWEEGSYWHLATRREELAALRDPAFEVRAHDLDRTLGAARYRTLIHGDAKPANFCFTQGGHRVAAVDFQYTGGGSGMRDVAYLLHGSVGEAEVCALLDVYFEALLTALAPDVDAHALEAEWRALYGVAVEDFERFLRGWRM
jgi:aminoglycoside/choline kinase family phosphotransferase